MTVWSHDLQGIIYNKNLTIYKLRFCAEYSEERHQNSVTNENSKVVAMSKYSKIGISKLGINLLSSDCDINNYTILPSEFENQYFYTYFFDMMWHEVIFIIQMILNFRK